MNDSHLAQAIDQFQRGNLDQAVQIALRVAESDPAALQAKSLAGVAATMLGRFAMALPLFEKVEADRPSDPEASYNVGYVQKQLGRYEAAIARFERALSLQADYFEALHNCGASLHALKRYESAVDCYRRALKVRPNHPLALRDLADSLSASGDVNNALKIYREVMSVTSDAPEIAVSLGLALLKADRPQEALDVTDRALAGPVRHGGLVQIKAAAHGLLGDTEEAQRLEDYESLIKRFRPGQPPEYGTLQAFHDALEGHIRRHPSLNFEPGEQNTRGGSQTGELLVDPKGPMAVFEVLISNALRQYLGALPFVADHSYLKERPDSFQISAWATLLGPQGHQIAHMHPDAWVSGVYYVKLPSSAGDGPQGVLEFGAALPGYPERFEGNIHRIVPEEGLLLLFPAYLRHRIVPVEADGERIAIAFDAVAAG